MPNLPTRLRERLECLEEIVEHGYFVEITDIFSVYGLKQHNFGVWINTDILLFSRPVRQ